MVQECRVEQFNGLMDRVASVETKQAIIYYCNRPNPQRSEENHDSLLIRCLEDGSLCLAVADGAGGHRTPAEASSSLLGEVDKSISDSSLDGIVESIEKANLHIRNALPHSRSTLMLATIQADNLRSIHIGDSKLIVIGGRGRLKYETIGHNLYEICHHSGLSEFIDDTIEVPSNIVTNMIGDASPRIDVSSNIKLAPNDTVILGSDGLFDNFTISEICEKTKDLSLDQLASFIDKEARRRMSLAIEGTDQFKADDMSFIAFRQT